MPNPAFQPSTFNLQGIIIFRNSKLSKLRRQAYRIPISTISTASDTNCSTYRISTWPPSGTRSVQNIHLVVPLILLQSRTFPAHSSLTLGRRSLQHNRCPAKQHYLRQFLVTRAVFLASSRDLCFHPGLHPLLRPHVHPYVHPHLLA